jgi:hypothetical protein
MPAAATASAAGLRHLRDAFLVAVVRHQVVPVRILILDAADVHTHRVQFAQ